MLYAQDFAGSAGTDILTLSPQVGSNALGALVTGVPDIRLTGSGRTYTVIGNWVLTNESFTTADYIVRVRFVIETSSSSDLIQIAARSDRTVGVGTTPQDDYNLFFQRSTGAVTLRRRDNGSSTQLGTTTISRTVGDTVLMELVCNGSAISAKIDGTTVIGPITDTTYTAAGQAMIYVELNNKTSTEGLQMDDFEVDDQLTSGPAFRSYYITG